MRKLLGTLIILAGILMAIGAISAAKHGAVAETEDLKQSVSDQVLADSIDQLKIAARHGSKIDICVQVGFVKAAALQAKNDAEYNRWVDYEADNCKGITTR